MKVLLIFTLMIFLIGKVQGHDIFKTITNDQKIDRYIFVSTKMPDQDLIELAAQAQISKMTMVLFGFIDSSSAGLEHTKIKIFEINNSCCSRNGPSWMIYPLLFEKFNVRVSPSFVISKKTPLNPSDFVMVSGEMSVQNALKYIYAGAINPLIRADAKSAYKEFPDE